MNTCKHIFAKPTYMLTCDSTGKDHSILPSIKTCLQLSHLGLCCRFASSHALHSEAREWMCTAVLRPLHFFIQDSYYRQSRAPCFEAKSLFDLHHSLRLSSLSIPFSFTNALPDLIPEIFHWEILLPPPYNL